MHARELGFPVCFMLLVSGFLFMPSAPATITASTLVATDGPVITAMRQMADWQITALGTSQDDGWDTATFFQGLLALYQVTGDSQYLNRAVSWGNANNWAPDAPPSSGCSSTIDAGTRCPDSQNAGQAYLEMYILQGSSNSAQLTPTKNVMDGVIANGGTGQQAWWQADWLYMPTGVFARLGYATGDANYFSFMDTWYWESANYLIDPAYNLFWRDATFFGMTCPNGQPMFWSRGNAWVIAGLVRILEFLPQNDADRPEFVSLLQRMAAALAPLQRPDGYWSSCLTDTTDYPEPETSGTAGFVYAMAWGINNGLLDAATYTPIVQKGWNALVNAIQANGALGWVQPEGDQPGSSSASDTFLYGIGLALLAGSEVAKMNNIAVTTTSTISSTSTTTTSSTSTTATFATSTQSTTPSVITNIPLVTGTTSTTSTVWTAKTTAELAIGLILGVILLAVGEILLVRRRKATATPTPTASTQPAGLYCSNCGSTILPGSKFCDTCGAQQ